jgi:glycosyltransferase involved in cell wall biosynthesis
MLAADLAAGGFEVFIVTRRSDAALAATDVIDGVQVYRIAPAGPGRWSRWLMVPSTFRILARMRHRYDVLFVSGFKALGVPAVLASRLFGKVCILKADSNGEMSGAFFRDGLSALGLTPHSRVFRAFLAVRNRVLRRADGFVAITSSIAEEFGAHRVRREIIHVVTNAVDTNTYRPAGNDDKSPLRRRLGLPKKTILITYTGRLVTYKGVPLLVRVVERLQHDHDVGLVLVGSGGLDIHNCEADLRAYVGARGLSGGIHFAGEVRNVHEHLQASDIFVLPTEEDAFPLALIEAMACGLPVVSTPIGGIPEIITHGTNGLLVQPGGFDQLRDALRDLIANRDRAASLGEAAARTARARYSREAITKEYVELFNRAAGFHEAGPSRAAALRAREPESGYRQAR